MLHVWQAANVALKRINAFVMADSHVPQVFMLKILIASVNLRSVKNYEIFGILFKTGVVFRKINAMNGMLETSVAGLIVVVRVVRVIIAIKVPKKDTAAEKMELAVTEIVQNLP